MAGISPIDIAVVGAGPAGAAVALALTHLGHAVTVIAVPRAFAACEGVSERVLRGLADAGLGAALADVPAATPRSVCWNGEQRAANTEHLLSRRELDRALLAELRRSGLNVRAERVNALRRESDGHVALQLGERSLRARLVIDARGRAATRGGGQRLRGPETVSLLQRWTGPRTDAGSSCVLSFADGWAWLACSADGQRYTQLTLAADAPDMPRRGALATYLCQRLAALPAVADWIAACAVNGPPIARSSTAILHSPLIDRGVIRIGDAAMAVDPLSGNGIFQALSSASVAPAVVNTLLRDPDGAALAERFYGERVAHIFSRFARIGRDFHRAETRWPQQPFWNARRQWPDDEPAHDSGTRRLLGVALRPVVDNGFIRERDVVLSSDQPLGVWRVAGVEVAPLLHGLPANEVQRERILAGRIAAIAGSNGALAQALRAWFAQYLPPPGPVP
ncbi:MAG: FAD-dependent oxidoreductase [Gammaproteobacteria bacterium]|nr:FAD-dependent oxidoreductase [Gammaproteobacteria bacterium]MBK7727886.1 FAD-dependent oxidoreductase [Gammaproteobacteria bacterium]MBP6050803.1 FAD-dependent oxidoreductase [Pseudomonadales bacterium]